MTPDALMMADGLELGGKRFVSAEQLRGVASSVLSERPAYG